MLLHSASGLVHNVNHQDPRHTLGTHCVEGFVVTTDNHQKDKIQTIPRHVQQYKNLCDNQSSKILWSIVSNAAERSNSSSIIGHLLSMDQKISS